jgi:hypothetical protein
MENKEIKLYVKFPFYFYFIVGFLIILPLFSLIEINYNLKIKIISIIVLFLGIFMLLVLISINIFRKTGYIITKEGITSFSLLNKKIILWDQIVSYTVNGYEKNNDLFLRFYTGNSLKNKGIKPKYEINISTKYCKININELIKEINKIRD